MDSLNKVTSQRMLANVSAHHSVYKLTSVKDCVLSVTIIWRFHCNYIFDEALLNHYDRTSLLLKVAPFERDS